MERMSFDRISIFTCDIRLSNIREKLFGEAGNLGINTLGKWVVLYWVECGYSAPSPETYFIALTLTFLPNTLLCFKIKLPCFEFGEKNKEHVLHICTLCNNGCV